jgi:polysaccharide transporter, PST family
VKKLYSNASWYAIEKLARMVGAFVVGAWVARYLGPEQYGSLAFALALTLSLGFLSSWGIESLAVRDMAQQPENINQIASTYFFVRLAGALAAPLIAFFFVTLTHQEDTELRHLALILSFSVPLMAFEVADCWLQSQHLSRQATFIRLSGFTAGAAAKVLLVTVGADLFWFAIANVFETLTIAALYATLLQKSGVSLSPAHWNNDVFRNMFLKSKGMILSALAVVIYSRLDVLAVGSLLSRDELGHYAMAASFSSAWSVLGMSLGQAHAPHLSSLRQINNTGAYMRALRRFLIIMLVIPLTGSFLLASCAGQIFHLVLGPEFNKSGELFALLVWSSIPIYLGIATSQIIVDERIYWASLVRTLMGLIVSIILAIPLIGNYGADGAAMLMITGTTAATMATLLSSKARQIIFLALFSTKHEPKDNR